MPLVNRELAVIDDTLIRLRRLWQGPAAQTSVQAGPDGPEMSTVLVVDAVSRHQRQRPGAPVRIADVAERLDVAPSTASRLVDRAAKAGMLVRDADPADSRRAALVLTSAGDTLSERALTFRTGYLERVLTGWTRTDMEPWPG